MNIEVVAAKLQGTFSCGSQAKPDPNVLRSGWHSAPCDCNNAEKFANCGRALGAARANDVSAAVVSTRAQVAPDCSSATPQDPPFFSECAADGPPCMRVAVASSIAALVLSNSTAAAGNATAGFDYCIDSTSRVVYAKLAGPPAASAAFFQVLDDATDKSCRFLTQHFIDGDVVRVYAQSNLTCTLDWTQLPSPDGITKATLNVTYT